MVQLQELQGAQATQRIKIMCGCITKNTEVSGEKNDDFRAGHDVSV